MQYNIYGVRILKRTGAKIRARPVKHSRLFQKSISLWQILSVRFAWAMPAFRTQPPSDEYMYPKPPQPLYFIGK